MPPVTGPRHWKPRAFGWDVTRGEFDWPSFRTNLHSELDRLEAVYIRNLKAAGVEIYHQRAVLTDPN